MEDDVDIVHDAVEIVRPGDIEPPKLDHGHAVRKIVHTAVGQIINHSHARAGGNQCINQMRSDKAGSAGDKHALATVEGERYCTHIINVLQSEYLTTDYTDATDKEEI